jgi:FkbM family methyltransferase
MIQNIKKFFFQSKRKILAKTLYRKNFKTPEFYDFYFSQPGEKYIVQVGGNDGIQNDPLRIYFKSKKNYKAIIFEPIQYYYHKLKQLYHNRDDILIKQQYVSSEQGEKKIYFIKPKVCDSIEIDNQNNDWLHGLGSFDKKNVINAIDQNSLGGEKFRKNIENLKNNIIVELVSSFALKNLNFSKNSLNLIVIDVQGFELEVLLSLSFNEKIDYIVYEDENPYSHKSHKIRKLLNKHHYKLIGRLTWVDQIYKKIF